VALSVLAAAAGIFPRLAWSEAKPAFAHGAALNPSKPLPDVTLVAPSGARVRLTDYRGRWLWVFFGYTHCPDVCPTALGELAREYKALGVGVKRLQVLFISVDPQRDTPARMGEYVRYFHPQFVAFTGSVAAIDEVARAFGARYRRHDTGSAAGYLVDHTTAVYVVDPEGQIKAIYPPGLKPGALASDFAFLKETPR
jgi:protein SCO1/2